tara:strand:+ start:2605 stop:2955 length:351 start_codon:yes stop_codon:yes gene_type:complete
MTFVKGVCYNPNGKPPTYKLSRELNKRYSMAKAQAKFRGEEWAFTDETWHKLWVDSGHIEHMGRQIHQYCMVRKDPLEAWGPHNCIIVTRRKHLRKKVYERWYNVPYRDYEDGDSA